MATEFSKLESEILEFWKREKIFEKTLAKASPEGEFVFYDGPPFATGLPHYGHIVASVMKDVVPRYWTMRGYHVGRQWGWDCHGLPIENIIEQELRIKNKRDIEKMGVDKFNEACRVGVLRYVDEWKKFIPKTGRWVDMDHPYTTMDTSYTESIWWVFKQLHDKGLIYEGRKSMHICPRCGTPLSNFEVTQGYKDVKDQSVMVAFPLRDDSTTSFLAWTTTPWTLPGNVGLAVKEDVEYVQFYLSDAPAQRYIVAKDRLEHVANGKAYVVQETMQGKDLVGKKYVPLFSYYTEPIGPLSKTEALAIDRSWKIVSDKGIDFVTLEDGTGIVHMAPAFGEDDMQMGEKYGLRFIQHVGEDGRFKEEVKDFAGLEVKPKGNPQETDKKIVAWIKEQGRLFHQDEITHSYPHCWRCDTPLLNYATTSWFVKVTALKDQMIKNNKKIHWVPEHVKEGRFGKWLEGAKDWAISRRRYWGAPLPVWRCHTGKLETLNPKSETSGCGRIFVAGSVADITWPTKLKNTYWLARHGECTHNLEKLVAPDDREFTSLKPLTELTKHGRAQIKDMGAALKDQEIDVIVSSDLARTKETAEGIAKAVKAPIEYEPLLREVRPGDFMLKPQADIKQSFDEYLNVGAPGGGESLVVLRDRMHRALENIETKYQGKNIVIVGHGDPLWILEASLHGIWGKDLETAFYPAWGSVHRLYDIPVNLHRPTIDAVTMACPDCSGVMQRIPEVFDCWFESGSMPYAQLHYPFENKEKFEKNFPAQFIAEGLDQTRGWFYTLLVLSTALFGKQPFENVIVNGLVLAEDGRKMSKRLKNYPDPEVIVQKYGADAMRLYLLQSPVMHAEDLKFSEKGVAEVHGKILTILANVLAFYKQYADTNTKSQKHEITKARVLDRWILARLQQLIQEVTSAMDAYDLMTASRALTPFVDDLSTWYVRRSRDRFKDEETRGAAVATLHEVLLTLAKVLAPFAPFFAEHLYRELRIMNHELWESVHLELWPSVTKKLLNEELLTEMERVRKAVTLMHAVRETAGIKVRQPLATLSINEKFGEDSQQLLREEANVKEIVFEKGSQPGFVVKQDGGFEVRLDPRMTPELKEEGVVREFTRAVNGLRKEKGLTIRDSIAILVGSTDAQFRSLIARNEKEIMSATIAKELVVRDGESADASQLVIDTAKLSITITKL